MTEPYERPLNMNLHLTKRQILINNFLGGIAWGVGSVIGASIIVVIIGYFLKLMGVFAAIGNFSSSLL